MGDELGNEVGLSEMGFKKVGRSSTCEIEGLHREDNRQRTERWTEVPFGTPGMFPLVPATENVVERL